MGMVSGGGSVRADEDDEAGEQSPSPYPFRFQRGLPSPLPLHLSLPPSPVSIGKDKLVLTGTERLVAFSVLRQTYASQPLSANPFLRFLVSIAGDDEAEKFERVFILQLLELSYSSSIKEDNAAKNVLADPDVVPLGCDADSSEFVLQPGSKAKLGSGERYEIVIGLLANLSLEGLGPQWIRPRPPRLPIQDGELVWLIPDNNHELLWDHGMCADTSRGAAVRDLIAKAAKGPLVPAQQEDFPYYISNILHA